MQRASATNHSARGLEGALRERRLGRKGEPRLGLLCRGAPCRSPLHGVLRLVPPPRGQGRKWGTGQARRRPALIGRIAPGVSAAWAPHPLVTALRERMEKASAPLCCIHYSELPTAQRLLWGCVRSTSQGQSCLLGLRRGRQTQRRDPRVGRCHLLAPWLSKSSRGPGRPPSERSRGLTGSRPWARASPTPLCMKGPGGLVHTPDCLASPHRL